MEQIGAVQLGKKTNKSLLKGLLPKEWEEVVYEHERFWSCKCKRDSESQKKGWLEKEIEFSSVCDNIINEFGDHLMEIYSIESNGLNFVVYLRKKVIQE